MEKEKMGIIDYLKNKKEDYQANQQIKEVARQQAQMEAQEILNQRKAEEQRMLLEQTKQKELEKLTTPPSQRLVQGVQKIGGVLKEAGQRAGTQLEQLGQDTGKEFSYPKVKVSGSKGKSKTVTDYRAANIGQSVVSPSVIPKQTTPIKDLISQDNTNTPIGNKIFGNSMNPNKNLVGGSFNKEKIRKFL